MYHLSIGIIAQTKVLLDELQTALENLPVRVALELPEIADWNMVRERIDRTGVEVILLDLATVREPLEDLVARLRSTSNQPQVFAMNTQAETGTVLAALRSGVNEYLYPPLAVPLRTALEKAASARERTATAIRAGGKALAFVSAKGGCGATTIACHVAMELPRYVKNKILLADFDTQAGLVGFLTKAKSAYTIADAVENLQRLDVSYWKAIVSNGLPDLEIVTAPLTPAGKSFRPEQLKHVLRFARKHYAWTVADLGRNVNAGSLSTLEEVDEVYLVTTVDVPALHQAKQMIRILVESGYPTGNIRLILNRAPKRIDVTLEELEKMLGASICISFPNDPEPLHEAYADGKLLSPDTVLGRRFSDLARRLAGVQEEKKKFRIFG